MDSDEFRIFGKKTVDYVADYLDNIRERRVLSSVEPGYLQHLLPKEPLLKCESWRSILDDIDKIIMPGLTHWHSPNFHAYYPTANSYPGAVGELLMAGLGVISTDQFPNPTCITLEQKMMNWLAKLLHLPEQFFGNGVIQNLASDSTLLSLLTAKRQKINQLNVPEGKLVAYTSEQSNSSVEKAGLLASVTMRLLPTDPNGSLRGNVLLQAIHDDLQLGLTPCCVIATLGTTGTCAFDYLEEIGPICKQFGMWLHIDAAYAGTAFCCPEYRDLMKGVEFADSFSFNPHKWMLVNTDCSAMWFKDPKLVDQIPDVRRFRALKLWLVLRIYGVEGIRQHVREQIKLAEYFAGLVKDDYRFEVCTASMELVCFRLKGDDSLTRDLLDRVFQRKLIFIMPYIIATNWSLGL